MILTIDFNKRSHSIRSIIGPCSLAAGLVFFLNGSAFADTPGIERTEVATQAAQQQEDEQRVEAIFADGADMVEIGSERCLPARRIRGVDVLDNRTVVFDMGRKDNYLVRLKHQCFGLRRDSAISYEMRGGRLCRLDGFRSIETWGLNRFVPGPRCLIPAFIKLSEAELELVEAKVLAAKAARVAQRNAKKAARRAAKEAKEQARSPQGESALMGG